MLLIPFLLLFSLVVGQNSDEKEVLARAIFTQSHANGETDELVAEMHVGEDPAKAAVLFCNRYKLSHDNAFIIQVAQNLNNQLEARGLVERANSFLNLT